MKKIVLCLASLIPASSWGQEVCTQNAMKVDVCQVATNISEEIARDLPLRLSSSLVLQHIGASLNQISMRAMFDYPEVDLVERARGVPLDTMKKSVRDNAIAMACRPKTELHAFIVMGGKLQFVYLFSDRAHFLTVNVDRCGPQTEARAS
ncbi:MAG TPA: hypothetical protein VNQ97_09820 [Burkholderiaceae bacterium]|nr:hypothetical protein [Burkholderiaceae bacterium]